MIRLSTKNNEIISQHNKIINFRIILIYIDKQYGAPPCAQGPTSRSMNISLI